MLIEALAQIAGFVVFLAACTLSAYAVDVVKHARRRPARPRYRRTSALPPAPARVKR